MLFLRYSSFCNFPFVHSFQKFENGMVLKWFVWFIRSFMNFEYCSNEHDNFAYLYEHFKRPYFVPECD